MQSAKKKNLVVIDLGGRVVPSENSVLESKTSQSNKVLGFWHVHKLLVNPWGHMNHYPTIVV